MELIADIIISALLVIAGVFGLVGSYGLVKLRDPMMRLHAPTKATTVGVGGVLLASMLWFWVHEGKFTFHELMITLFLFLTAPITAHFISKANMHLLWKAGDLPPAGKPDATPEEQNWATFTAGTDTAAAALADHHKAQ
jgi:multicomponent K+:H+ antiporter subunit G